MNQLLTLVSEPDFIDSLYSFAYKRTNSALDAQDLASDIITQVLVSAQKNSHIDNPHAYVWAIARRVYADFSHKRSHARLASTPLTDAPRALLASHSNIDDYIESEHRTHQLRQISQQISFLSRLYREVCIMYYLDEMKVSDIAKALGVAETTVKQRLYTARETIKKEVTNMDNNLDKHIGLKPIYIDFWGMGDTHTIGDPSATAKRRGFSQSLVYLCKDQAKTVKELSAELHTSMIFVEEEVQIQVAGERGGYGLLRETDKGKYIANFIIIEHEKLRQIEDMYAGYSRALANQFKQYLENNREKLLGHTFLTPQTDMGFVAYALVSRICWQLVDRITAEIQHQYMADVPQTKRDFFTFGVVMPRDSVDDVPNKFYGMDGANMFDIEGYERIHVTNMYGKRVNKYFSHTDNLANDRKLRLAIKAIHGLPIDQLSESDKEVASRAIEIGYLIKKGDTLYPKILMMQGKQTFNELITGFVNQTNELVAPTAKKMHGYIKSYVPKHLLGEWRIFVEQTANSLIYEFVEACIDNGALNIPGEQTQGEGVVVQLDKVLPLAK